MISHPDPETVLGELGDKVTAAISEAVRFAELEFRKYRQMHPDWAAENAARTFADLIHDWMWTVLKHRLDALPHVNIIDKEPTRQISVQVQSDSRLSYLLRFKLHHLDGRTSSYQTQSVIDFEFQGTNRTFPGFGEVGLEAGYEWNKDARTVGAAVISLRDGRDNIIWVHPLPAPEAKDDKVTRPMVPGPTSPTVGIQGVATDEQAGSDQT